MNCCRKGKSPNGPMTIRETNRLSSTRRQLLSLFRQCVFNSNVLQSVGCDPSWCGEAAALHRGRAVGGTPYRRHRIALTPLVPAIGNPVPLLFGRSVASRLLPA